MSDHYINFYLTSKVISCIVPSISLICCKVGNSYVVHLQFDVFQFWVFWAVFTFGGSSPALIAHGSLYPNQENQIKLKLHVDLCLNIAGFTCYILCYSI
jgi:hypothetical protein